MVPAAPVSLNEVPVVVETKHPVHTPLGNTGVVVRNTRYCVALGVAGHEMVTVLVADGPAIWFKHAGDWLTGPSPIGYVGITHQQYELLPLLPRLDADNPATGGGGGDANNVTLGGGAWAWAGVTTQCCNITG